MSRKSTNKNVIIYKNAPYFYGFMQK